MNGRGQLARLRRELSARDLAILHDLDRVRLLHARQVQRLHFHDGSNKTRIRRTNRVLHRLHHAGLVVRLRRRVGGVYAGSSGYIYTLSSLGQRLLATSGPAGGQRRRKPWEPSAHFVDHILDVAELYVQAHEAEARDRVRSNQCLELIAFDAEPACWRTIPLLGGGTSTLKPDAFLRMASGDYEQVSFIEIDRGTEHAPTLRRKLATYLDAYSSGVEQRDGEAFPNVVWLTPDEARADVLRRQVARLPPDPPSTDLFTIRVNDPTNNINALTPLKGGERQ